jgi:hypothetical protein
LAADSTDRRLNGRSRGIAVVDGVVLNVGKGSLCTGPSYVQFGDTAGRRAAVAGRD